MSARRGINPAAWLFWFVAAGVVPLTSRHPYYLVLTLIVVIVVHLSIPAGEVSARSWRLFAYVGSSVAVFSIIFNVLTVHSGDRVFGSLPDGLPIIGGALTWNALLYGAASATAISSVLFAAATFNASVRHAELIRILPARFQRLGVAGAIALTFVPQTMQAGRDIYDAQRARGRSMRGVRDAHAFLVPLLGAGLERAVAMSEALETRGYGSRDSARRPAARARRLVFPLALGFVVAALPVLASGRLAGAFALVVAAALLVGLSGRRSSSTRRKLAWNRPSCIVGAASLLALLIIGTAIATSDTLSYSPFPRLLWPAFDPLLGLAIALLIAPALAAGREDA